MYWINLSNPSHTAQFISIDSSFAGYESFCFIHRSFDHILCHIMQRFLIKEAQRGSTEIEAYRNLMEILGIEYPKEKEDN